MAYAKNTYLGGKILISSPKMEDDVFAESVVYLCSHDREGAMGFVVNKKLKDFSFSDLAVPLDIAPPRSLDNMFLYQGGPIEKVRGFVLHSAEYYKPGTYQIDQKISVSSSMEVLKDIAYGIGPVENLVALGYCIWAPAQLEKEIINNDWFVTDASNALLFHTSDSDKWQLAMDQTHIDLSRFIFEIAHA